MARATLAAKLRSRVRRSCGHHEGEREGDQKPLSENVNKCLFHALAFLHTARGSSSAKRWVSSDPTRQSTGQPRQLN